MNLRGYLRAFSASARDILEQFKFDEQITRLDDANLLYQIVGLFSEVDLHPDVVPNHIMGSVFEELIRRFNEKKNEEAGDHYTPREIIRLMVDLLFVEDDQALRRAGIVRTLFDPACGTGGMLSVAEEYLRELNADARLEVFGQELNPESYAICKSDMIIKGQNPFVSIGYAMPFFFAATHWYIYGLNPWMAAHAVLLPLFFFLAISNGITRHKNELRWRGYKSTDALTDTFERYVDATYPEFGQRQQTPPAVPGVVTYRG